MVIDLLEKQRVNIKDLSIQTPEAGQFTIPGFDPEAAVTAKMWAKIQDNLEFKATPNKDIKMRNEKYVNFLRNISLAFPSKMAQIQMNKAERKKYLDTVNNFGAQEFRQGLRVAEYALSLKQLYPELDYRDFIGAKGYASMVNELRSEARQKMASSNNGTAIAIDMKLLVPFQHLERRVKDECSDYFRWGIAYYMNNPGGQVPYLTALRLHFPEQFAGVHIDRKTWEETKKPFLQWPEHYVLYAFMLKILSAEKVVFQESGIDLIMPQNRHAAMEEARPPLPETRQF